MARATIWAGASGYSFKEWKGSFYPARMKPEEMLAWYADRLPTVEINNTFYRMPNARVLEHWASATPRHFRFAIKAPRRITHFARLEIAKAVEPVNFLYRSLEALGDKLGPVLYQLPPAMKKDEALLAEFLELLPKSRLAAFEFRHESWHCEGVAEALRRAGAALCASEREDGAPPSLVETSQWGYVRLRLETYSDDELERWGQRLASTRWRDVYVYFMHEPTAPAYAQKLMSALPRSPSEQADRRH